jgi:hypothetical protein
MYKSNMPSPKWGYTYYGNNIEALDSEEGDLMASITSPVPEGDMRWMSNPMNPLFDADEVSRPSITGCRNTDSNKDGSPSVSTACPLAKWTSSVTN